MAACGIDCSECGSYKVTMYGEMEAAALLVDWYRSQGWIGENEGAAAVLNKNPLCKGCWDITDDCFWKCGCGSTDFRICCKERQINHCGECADFPCGHYIEWAGWNESHKNAMEHLLSLRENIN
ncbi:MAG: DUF3795 domain-containing protein [Oscillospiraceae bacterium]|nr:DUF3795 domain-containing protein [Oscillospiraceae bacterium]